MRPAQPAPMGLSAPRARHHCCCRTGSVWLPVARATFRISSSAQVPQSKKGCTPLGCENLRILSLEASAVDIGVNVHPRVKE